MNVGGLIGEGGTEAACAGPRPNEDVTTSRPSKANVPTPLESGIRTISFTADARAATTTPEGVLGLIETGL